MNKSTNFDENINNVILEYLYVYKRKIFISKPYWKSKYLEISTLWVEKLQINAKPTNNESSLT